MPGESLYSRFCPLCINCGLGQNGSTRSRDLSPKGRANSYSRKGLLKMRVIRRILRRQQRVAYFFIYFFFLALAIPLARAYGRAVTLALCAGFIVLLEIGYRRLVLLEARNRRRWWAKQWKGDGLRIYFYPFLILVALLVDSPFARYALLALLGAGLICAGAIRLPTKDDSDSLLRPKNDSGEVPNHVNRS